MPTPISQEATFKKATITEALKDLEPWADSPDEALDENMTELDRQLAKAEVGKAVPVTKTAGKRRGKRLKVVKQIEARHKAVGTVIMEHTRLASDFFQFRNIPMLTRMTLKSSNHKFETVIMHYRNKNTDWTVLACFGTETINNSMATIAECCVVNKRGQLLMIEDSTQFPDFSKGSLTVAHPKTFPSNIVNKKDIGAELRMRIERLASVVEWNNGEITLRTTPKSIPTMPAQINHEEVTSKHEAANAAHVSA